MGWATVAQVQLHDSHPRAVVIRLDSGRECVLCAPSEPARNLLAWCLRCFFAMSAESVAADVMGLAIAGAWRAGGAPTYDSASPSKQALTELLEAAFECPAPPHVLTHRRNIHVDAESGTVSVALSPAQRLAQEGASAQDGPGHYMNRLALLSLLRDDDVDEY
eukprot:NODE_794_length_1175_cov_242.284192_g563_i0.p2 GENE.NODE_794_length_1175_cov_242.284192_g563_i0~~NODE_794_length_1175_cov_242.284192_g563_i0.p2  ORF type:complete len:171 (+),score=42.98 NODE_794_length_1175_cov_242.284192_g563_i0:26-514(+)